MCRFLFKFVFAFPRYLLPSKHTTLKQRRFNVDATSTLHQRWIDVFQRCVPSGSIFIFPSQLREFCHFVRPKINAGISLKSPLHFSNELWNYSYFTNMDKSGLKVFPKQFISCLFILLFFWLTWRVIHALILKVPSGHRTFIQRCIYIAATSWRLYNVALTSMFVVFTSVLLEETALESPVSAFCWIEIIFPDIMEYTYSCNVSLK